MDAAAPDLMVRAWVGERLAADWHLKGRGAGSREVEVPLSEVGDAARAGDASGGMGTGEGAAPRVVLQSEGRGPLYWRIGMSWLPEGPQPAVAHGLSVTRRYAAVDDPADVRRDADGTWHVRAGARVRVMLSVRARGARRHVALVDPLPAGLESAGLGAGRGDFSGMWQHREVADAEARAFAEHLPAGWHEWSYFARATTIGTFAAPGTVAEEMYAPETFGRAGEARVVVEAGAP